MITMKIIGIYFPKKTKINKKSNRKYDLKYTYIFYFIEIYPFFLVNEFLLNYFIIANELNNVYTGSIIGPLDLLEC